MLRPRHLAPALSVALTLLLAAGACTLDADTTQDQTGPTVATDAQPSEAATSIANRVDDGTGGGASGEGVGTVGDIGEADEQLSEAASAVTASTVAKRVEDGGADEADGGTGEDGSAIPDGTITDGHYADPRGEAYEQFQSTFDRTHPFQALDAFCLPTPVPDTAPVATQPGITADSVTLVHLHTLLAELEKIGFSAPVGDVDDILRAFVGLVNEECGGIHGRRLDLRTVEVSALGGGGHDIDTRREAACLESLEIHEALAVLSVEAVPGTAAQCLTVSGLTSFLTVRGTSDRDERRAGGLLFALEPGDRIGLEAAVRMAEEAGLLTDATVGLVLPDAPQRSDDVADVLVGALEDLGHEPTIHLLGCEGTTTCRVGLDTAVAAMAGRGVDVVFPLLNRTSMPWLILEMLDQGMPRPTFIQSGLDGQGLDAVSSQVAEFGGSPAGGYYDGAWLIDASATGSHRLDGFETRPFDEMCNRSYAQTGGRPPANADDRTDDVYRTVTEACSLVRAIARALHDAGPDPTRLGFQVALAALGSVDVPDMRPATSYDGHLTTQVKRYEYPCVHGSGFGATEGCLVPISEPLPLD